MSVEYATVGIYHHPTHPPAKEFAGELRRRIQAESEGLDVWIASAFDPVASTRDLPHTDLLICLGGDGTVLRAARAVIPHAIPILGVDMGRVAFLTEFTPQQMLERLAQVLSGQGRLEARAMIDVRTAGFADEDAPQHVHALNDVIVGRRSVGRPIAVNVRVDGDLIGIITADAVIVATATGSTGYSLSAGGPVLHPLSRSLVVTPVASHLSTAAPIVLPEDSAIDLSAVTEGTTALSIDGQGQYEMSGASTVNVKRSNHIARLLRFWDDPLYEQLGRRLSWLDDSGAPRPPPRESS
jgi:NAD+ kinase